ncbi:growth arrest-specific protein 1a [Hippocampus zosterae]|uniref:growth arrest-specific protein 1a n=1 Tax=Hippocampus zosterae TaxID=109293 RepID=UPI00223DC886|nr:growth arrest-specific protein 1a [Hippocampus zosterae]
MTPLRALACTAAMATFGALARPLRRSPGPLTCVLLLAALSAASPPRDGRLICWQAIFNCQNEPECNYAYEQYLRACDPVLKGQKKCPSHCISSLVQLNLTRNGPSLETCSCERDKLCARTKLAIEPCLPRTTSSGCTEARWQCLRDPPCNSAFLDYMKHCGKLFSGKLFSGPVCSGACRDVIATMRKIPKGQQLDTCMCDGNERSLCEYVKSNMKLRCFDAPQAEEGSGSHDDYDAEDNDDDDDADAADVDYWHEPESGASRAEVRWVSTLLPASILALATLF